MSVTDNHEEKETIVIDVTLPGHAERVTTPLFTRTRQQLLEREGGRSFVTGKTAEEADGPLEAHHYFIERCLANVVDWREFCSYISRLKPMVDRAADFCEKNPRLTDVMDFVDDMTVNGMLIEKPLHTGKGTGIHYLPLPLWHCWLYGQQGFRFTEGIPIYHEDEAVK